MRDITMIAGASYTDMRTGQRYERAPDGHPLRVYSVTADLAQELVEEGQFAYVSREGKVILNESQLIAAETEVASRGAYLELDPATGAIVKAIPAGGQTLENNSGLGLEENEDGEPVLKTATDTEGALVDTGAAKTGGVTITKKANAAAVTEGDPTTTGAVAV